MNLHTHVTLSTCEAHKKRDSATHYLARTSDWDSAQWPTCRGLPHIDHMPRCCHSAEDAADACGGGPGSCRAGADGTRAASYHGADCVRK